MLQGLISKLTKDQTGERCWELINNGAKVIDVRSPSEYASGHLAQAENVPLAELDAWLAQVDNKQSSLVLYCGAGLRAQKGCDILKANGFECVTNAGSLNDLLCCEPKG